ncbi:MAG: ATP-binding protein [Fibromonadaceae bacterium]|jgi:AAA+ ATPase superfamily predicted ATPase|nr:ATP-binding protein [Fibromonadaceae bacterium]
MLFFDRKTELGILSRIAKQSKRAACFTMLVGRRRIGKTMLLLKYTEKQKFLYLFVSRNSESVLCRQFQQQAAAIGINIFGEITNFRNLFEQFLLFAKTTNYTLVIDEFQEFENINKAIFSQIQELWDKYKNDIKLNFIACGSIYSLMTNIFENKKEPLFGRLTAKIIIKPFAISVQKQVLKKYNPKYTKEDLLFFYSITGGVPQYMSLLMDAKATTKDKMLDFIVRPESPFLNDGKDLLVSEFGKDYGVYFSILQLIAAGKNSQSEIDSIIGKNTGAYLVNLEKEYSIIEKNKPMFSKPESRGAKFRIQDNFLRFWFRFIYPNQALIEMGKHKMLRMQISKNYEQYSGLLLEKYFSEKFAEEENFSKIGSYWDGKGENEIDLIAINDLNKTAVVAEIKRNKNKLKKEELEHKISSLQKHLVGYKVALRMLDMGEM